MSDAIAAVRRFNRFYTRQVGALREGLLDSRFTLTETRVLYELAHRDELTATDLARDLCLDPGYLSRILARFEADGLLARAMSEADRRRAVLRLTEAGQAAFAPLNIGAREEVAAWLRHLAEPARAELVAAMGRIEALLEPEPARPYVIRPPRAGDIGWVISRHGALYAAEYGFDSRFEALVATVAGAFLGKHDPARESCWIAERDGVNLGSIFLVRADDALATLRLLLVEPTARGQGIGRRLVDECLAFARAAGYRRVTLWTNDVLVAARRIYQQAGFTLIRSEPHRMFGPTIVGEDWDLTLR